MRNDPNFLKLTSLLHWKTDSGAITQADLDGIYNNLFEEKGVFVDGDGVVVEMITETADACLNGVAVKFENKIVLSIAIRNVAERFMVKKINDAAFVGSIESNQSQALLKRFERDFSSETDAIDVIKRVVLMTPENIHLNSFMYETNSGYVRRPFEETLSRG